MNKINLLILFSIILAGCKNSESKYDEFPGKIASVDKNNSIIEIKQKPTQIKIDLSKTIDGNFDDYFILKKVIFLDDKSPIGQINLIRQFKKNIFILDSENTQQLYCYDLEGKLIWEFKSKGKGPLEYAVISDFVINENKGTIDLLDNRKNIIINIDINTGIPKKSFKIGFYGREMILYRNGDYLLHTGNITVNEDLNYKLLLVNSNQKVKSKNLIVTDGESMKFDYGFRSIEQYEDIIYFTESLNDTIYTIKNDTLKTSYYVDFLDKKHPRELNEKFSFDKFRSMQKDKPFISNIDLVRKKNGVLNFMFSYNKSYYCAFYDINKKHTYIFNSLKNGTVSDVQQIFTQGYINDGFVSIIEPFMLDKLKKTMEKDAVFKDKIKTDKPELYNVILKTNENSNPILFIYEFKKNN
jgi:hypothetical protein